MRRRAALILVAALAVSAAPAGPAAASGRDARPRIYVVTPGTVDGKPAAAPMHRILFVNRNGGVYSPGIPSNSSANTSGILTDIYTVPAFEWGDESWAQVMACITLMYERFSITVTDVNPGDTPHMEAVVGGYAEDIGMSDLWGVAEYPAVCGGVNDRGVSFTFSAAIGNSPRDICETLAQESGHVMGLDHEYLCEDPMTYLWGCGNKTFQDVDAPCGEYGPRPCRCGAGAAQNSVQILYGLLGNADPVPPEVTITSPGEGATVAPGFVVMTSPMDNVRIARVELWIDGVYTDVFVAGEPWELKTPVEVAIGQHLVEARAIDGGTNVATASITVNVQPACAVDADCPPMQACGHGACAAGLGQPCERHTDCASLTCSRDPDNQRVCATECGGAGESCPEGFACQETTHLCFAGSAGGGGGCAAGGSGAGAGAVIVILLGLASARSERRRKKVA